ncbi:hypothetical protein LZ198_36400 [Myxococcus sp. K15C18031901]|uniref:hypothetical protein n=1 Tax=Myxococcus dinghuensis TaxID=2906761 RepID=UPI0020A72F1A|nr:hypothetical protein [Myxococcus dinghuensis]MCP3104360.1 hypothetical protein [Myxococcus dinghuensis]
MNVCVDACFLLALYDSRDGHHANAVAIFEKLFGAATNQLVVPWPILYETVSTRMARRSESMKQLERDLKLLRQRNRLSMLFDRKMREQALGECFDELKKRGAGYRALSLVDRVVRLMLLNPKNRLHALVTFNREDFEDVCRTRKLQLIDSPD